MLTASESLAQLAEQLAQWLSFEASEGMRTMPDPGILKKPVSKAPHGQHVANASALHSASAPPSASAPNRTSTTERKASPKPTYTPPPKPKAPAKVELRMARATRLPECGDTTETPIMILAEPASFEGDSRHTLDRMLYALGFKIEGEVEPMRRPKPSETPPKVALTLGHAATNYIVEGSLPFDAIMGIWHERNGVPVMPVFDPTTIKLSPGNKRRAWGDLLNMLDRLGLELPEWSKKHGK